MKKFLKKNIILKEDLVGTAKPAVAANTNGTNDSPQKIVNDTTSKNPNAGSVVIPGKEIDGNASTQTNRVQINNDPASLQNAQKMAQQFGRMGQDVEFEVNVHEGVKFTKKELNEWLKSL
jgi:hypothetical protein